MISVGIPTSKFQRFPASIQGCPFPIGSILWYERKMHAPCQSIRNI